MRTSSTGSHVPSSQSSATFRQMRRRDGPNALAHARLGLNACCPSPRLPQELLNIIIDLLQEYPNTLSALSLSARCLHFAARRCLFRSPTITTSRASLISFIQTLHNAPLHVRFYVEHLTLSLSGPLGPDHDAPSDFMTPILVASILQMLPSLRTLTLDKFRVHNEADATRSFEQRAMYSLEQLSLVGMGALLMDGFRDYLPIQSFLHSLDTFSISSTLNTYQFISPESVHDMLTAPYFPHDLAITHLRIDTPLLTHVWLRVLMYTRTMLSLFSTLQSLDVSCRHSFEVLHIGNFLQIAGPKLLRFSCLVHPNLVAETISCGYTFDKIVQGLAIRECCPVLETIAVRVSMCEFEGLAHGLFDFFTALLARTPHSMCAFVLELDLGRDVVRTSAFIRDEMQGEWARLKCVLECVGVAHLELVWRYSREGFEVADASFKIKAWDILNMVSSIMQSDGFALASSGEPY